MARAFCAARAETYIRMVFAIEGDGGMGRAYALSEVSETRRAFGGSGSLDGPKGSICGIVPLSNPPAVPLSGKLRLRSCLT